MKSLLRIITILGMASYVHAFSPTGYVQINPPIAPQSGGFNTSSGTVSGPFNATTINGGSINGNSITDNGLAANQCVQTGSGGLLTVTGSACGAGGGSGPSGIINTAVQYSAPYYSVTGSSNVLSGLAPGTSGQILTTGGSGVLPYWGNSNITSGSTFYIQNTSSLQSGATFYVSSGTVNGNIYATNFYFPGNQAGIIPTAGAIGLSNLGGDIYLSPQQGFRANITQFSTFSFISSNGYIGFVAPGGQTSTPIIYTLPSSIGSAGQFLEQVNSTGTLVWATGTGGLVSLSTGIITPAVMTSSLTILSSMTVANGLFTNISAGQCVQTGTNGQLTGTGATCGAGSGGGSGIVSPATFTWVNNFGMSMSTLTVSTITLKGEMLEGAGIGVGNTLFLHDIDSTFLGDAAGNSSLLGTSVQNTVVGVNSMLSPTAANNNAVFGYNSLNGFGTSNGNVAIGVFVLNNNAISQNVGVGFSALNTILGNNNVGVGYDSALHVVSGSSNTLVGASAYYGPDLSTAATQGSGNTFIGYEAGVSTSATINNAIAIGYGAVVGSSATAQIGGAPGTPTAVNVTAASMTTTNVVVNGTGNGNIQLTIASSTYTVTSSSGPSITAGHCVEWGSTNYSLVDAGSSCGTGSGSGGLVSLSTGIITPAIFTSSVTIQSSATITGANGLNVNFGITAASGTFNGTASKPTDVLLQISSTTSPIFIVNNGGNIISSGSTPSAGTCGTTPVMDSNSTNITGRITWGGAATSCGFNFANGGFQAPPFCLANTAGAGFTEETGVTASSATFTFSASLTGSTMTYVCIGGRGG